MIQQMLDSGGKLQTYVSKQGGPDTILHFGRKVTKSLDLELHFGNGSYSASFQATLDNRFVFLDESFCRHFEDKQSLGHGHFESKLCLNTDTAINFTDPMNHWRIYHFHDTGDSALVKRLHSIGDNRYLRYDASNLAAFLYLLKETHRQSYNQIVNTIKLVAPFFGDFCLRPSPTNPDMIELAQLHALSSRNAKSWVFITTP